MMRKISAVLAALAFALTTFAPVAEARDGRHRGYDRGYYGGGGYYGGHHRRHHDDDGDAVAAGAVGLILGLALGSMASQPRQQSYNGCYDRCAPPPPPPPRCYDRCGGGNYYDQGYRGSAYDQDYGLDGGYYEEQRPQCVRRERQWDRYANRYVVVDVPC